MVLKAVAPAWAVCMHMACVAALGHRDGRLWKHASRGTRVCLAMVITGTWADILARSKYVSHCACWFEPTLATAPPPCAMLLPQCAPAEVRVRGGLVGWAK